jgi:hypothetical protein
MTDIDVNGEPRTIRELLHRMADVLSTPDPHRARIQEISARHDARERVGVLTACETPPSYGSEGVSERLERLEPAVTQLQSSIDELRRLVDQIRLAMATKVELEGVRDDIRRVADGYGHVSAQLQQNSDLLKRFLTDVPR